MKNCDEMVSSLLERRDQYVTEQKRKRKMIIRTATSMCCVCLVALMGFGVWQNGWFSVEPPISINDSTIVGEKDYITPEDIESQTPNDESSNNPNENKVQQNSGNLTDSTNTNQSPNVENDSYDAIGMVVIDGITYIQFSIDENLFTANTCLGDAGDFSGYYDNVGISSTLYTTKESQNVVLVKLGNGATIVLGRFGELVVNGNTYFSTQIDANQFVKDECLGKAKDFEIISVPHRITIITSEDDIWSVKNDATKLIIKKADGSTVIFSALSSS